MSTLNLFPSRVAIGRVAQPGGGPALDVIMTPEFSRALSSLFDRVGGAEGLGNQELEILSMFEVAHDTSEQYNEAEDDNGKIFGLMQQMLSRIEALEARLENSSTSSVEVEIIKTRMAQEIEAAFVPPLPDWERPGQIGLRKANTGAFTTLSASGRISANLGLTVDGGTFISRGITDSATATALTFTSGGIASFGNTVQYFDEQVNIEADDTKLALRSSAGYTWSISNEGVSDSGKLYFKYEDGPLDVLILDRLGNGTLIGDFTSKGGNQFITTNTGLSSHSGVGLGTLTNAPTAGNPTKWIGIMDNGTLRKIPTWT